MEKIDKRFAPDGLYVYYTNTFYRRKFTNNPEVIIDKTQFRTVQINEYTKVNYSINILDVGHPVYLLMRFGDE